jgi:ribosomal protein L37AE/L43A
MCASVVIGMFVVAGGGVEKRVVSGISLCPKCKNILKFVIYTPTHSTDLLLTITRTSLCWRYK